MHKTRDVETSKTTMHCNMAVHAAVLVETIESF